MIPAYLVPLANHLWQSTVFAAVMAVLALVLRKNRASVRHRLWLAASLKFLLPFSLLIALGSRFEWRTAAEVAPAPLAIGMTEVSEPFVPQVHDAAPVVDHTPKPDRWPMVLFSFWALGALASLAPWISQWRRISNSLRRSTPVDLGLPAIQTVSCLGNAEPGVFGILRPVLLLPEGITDRLTAAELNAVLAHEVCHLRRRDNLANVLHMVVETLFWFHPLVWWIERRMIDEQENACDEEVLKLGSDPQAYAEGILKVCRHYLTSPLACVARVTGSDLCRRVETIMSERVLAKLSAAKAILLLTVGAATLSIPVLLGAMHSTRMQTQSVTDSRKTLSFEVATIKPHGPDGPNGVFTGGACHGSDSKYPPGRFAPPPQGRCVFTRVALTNLVNAAYFPPIFIGNPRKFGGGQAWTENEFWDVEAKAENTDNVTESQLKDMLKTLLAERFKLQFHREASEIPGYALVVGKNGLRIKEATSDEPVAMHATGDDYNFTRWPMSQFAQYLTGPAGAQVVDRTGLTGGYTFSFHMPPPLSATADRAVGDSGSSIFTVLEEQLGLRLEARKIPIDLITIDHAEKPSGDDAMSGVAVVAPIDSLDTLISQERASLEAASVEVKAETPVRILSDTRGYDLASSISRFGGGVSPARISIGLQQAKTAVAFEVASIKKAVFPSDDFFAGFAASAGPCRNGQLVISGNRVTINPVSLCGLISTAYDLRESLIVGVPNWAKQADASLYYWIEAIAPAGARDLTANVAKEMLKSLLADRFQLKMHREKREVPVYTLAVDPKGAKLALRADGPCAAASKPGQNPPSILIAGGTARRLVADCNRTMTIAQLVERLSGDSDRPIVDKTGIEGPQAFELEWDPRSGSQSNLPSLSSALQEQLGLRLQATKTAMDVLVVDSVQHPTMN